jgi:hypothetical protein
VVVIPFCMWVQGDATMMGMQVEAAQLFYEFRLSDHVPGDHLLRRIDRFPDLESVRRAQLQPLDRRR